MLQSRLDNDRQVNCLCRPEDGLKLSNGCSAVSLLFCLSRASLLRQTINYVLKLSAAIARDSVPCRSRDAGISKGRLAFRIFFCLEVSNLTARAALWNLPGFFSKTSKIFKDVKVLVRYLFASKLPSLRLMPLTCYLLTKQIQSVIFLLEHNRSLACSLLFLQVKRQPLATVSTVSWTVFKPSLRICEFSRPR